MIRTSLSEKSMAGTSGSSSADVAPGIDALTDGETM